MTNKRTLKRIALGQHHKLLLGALLILPPAAWAETKSLSNTAIFLNPWGYLPLILLLVGILLWSRSMKQQINHRSLELKQREEQYRLLADNMLDVIWTMDLSLEFTYVNQATVDLVGLPPEEVIGTNLSDHCDEENLTIMAKAVERAFIEGPGADPVFLEAALRHKDGHPVPVEIHGKVTYNELNEAVSLQGVTRDISLRKQAEEWLRRSESLLNTTQRISKTGGWEWSVDGNEMFWTTETFRIHGFEPDIGEQGREYIQKSGECYPDTDRPGLMAAFQRCLTEGTPYEAESRIIAEDGKQKWIRITGNAVYDDHRIIKVVGSLQDITRQRNAEQALRFQALLLKEMGDMAKIGAWEFNPRTGKGTWTAQVAKIHELDPDDETNVEKGLNYFVGPSKEKIRQAVKEASEKGIPYDTELELVTAKGNHKWVRTIGRPRMENGSVVQVRGSFQDITAEKITEQRIAHLNQVLRAIRDLSQLIVHEHDTGRLIQESCRLLVKNRGYASAVIILTDKNDRPSAWAQAGMDSIFDRLAQQLEKGLVPPCCKLDHTPGQVHVFRESENLCRQCPLSEGYPQNDSLCIRLFHDNRSFGFLIVSMAKGLADEAEERALFVEIAGDLAYALNVQRLDKARKASEDKRKSLEDQLAQAQKMESVGRLAGGVAHDYNNMLSVIMGYTEIAMEKIGPDDPVHRDLEEIFKAARHSVDITRQLLAFARKQTIAPQVLDLNETITSMLKMLQRLIGEDIHLHWRPVADLWPVHIDPSQMDQILANLSVNARDAISGIGKITIEAQNVLIDDSYSLQHPESRPGEYVLLCFSDDGKGMPPEILDAVFEPFFTTKGVGLGTGLGLSTIYGIVKQNQGFINAYSEPDQGTIFKIYLPRHTGQKEHLTHTAAETAPPKGDETILLVEDEAAILYLGRRMLESLGYTVLAVNSPEKAMEAAKGHGGRIHMLITDVVMPEMNGRDLSNALQALNPDMKTLFMSGYTANVIAHRGVLDKGVNFIQKPFSKKELALKVRTILDPAQFLT